MFAIAIEPTPWASLRIRGAVEAVLHASHASLGLPDARPTVYDWLCHMQENRLLPTSSSSRCDGTDGEPWTPGTNTDGAQRRLFPAVPGPPGLRFATVSAAHAYLFFLLLQVGPGHRLGTFPILKRCIPQRLGAVRVRRRDLGHGGSSELIVHAKSTIPFTNSPTGWSFWASLIRRPPLNFRLPLQGHTPPRTQCSQSGRSTDQRVGD